MSCFFIISGYLIVKSWDRNSDAKIFLANRVLRIYPGFIVASIFSAFLVGAFAGNIHYRQEYEYVKFFKNLLPLDIPKTPDVFKITISHLLIDNCGQYNMSLNVT